MPSSSTKSCDVLRGLLVVDSRSQQTNIETLFTSPSLGHRRLGAQKPMSRAKKRRHAARRPAASTQGEGATAAAVDQGVATSTDLRRDTAADAPVLSPKLSGMLAACLATMNGRFTGIDNHGRPQARVARAGFAASPPARGAIRVLGTNGRRARPPDSLPQERSV